MTPWEGGGFALLWDGQLLLVLEGLFLLLTRQEITVGGNRLGGER